MINANATMTDVLSHGSQRDCCVVLPTLDHAVLWWERCIAMFEAYQPDNVIRTKTALVLRGSQTAVRLWVPYSHNPTQPMDFEHDFVYRVDYLLLWGLSRKEDIKWVR